MSENSRRGLLSRIIHSWYTPAFLILLLIITVVIWALPRRIDQVSSADTDLIWDKSDAPYIRKVLWEPAQPIEDLIPGSVKEDHFVTPRLTDAGATLYFTYRTEKGDANIYKARLEGGQWQPAELVDALNSEAKDYCSSISPDGQTFYLYSNRKGGIGGFDIYISQRTETGWSKPKNLGPVVNSPLDEYDPALSPDGLTLYFASDRTQEMLERMKNKEKEWDGTLRTYSGLRQFDLYRCKKSSLEEDWSFPEPISELNQPTTNEGAPFLSPYGTFLYFVSDRPNESGPSTNKDLYRARLVNGTFQDLENLGPSVNSEKNELEPGLSPEGYTLIYSSDRDGFYKIYTSKAQEVLATSEWDMARWNLLMAWWWKILGLLLAFALFAFLLWYFRNWLFEKATAGRFLVASLLLHLLLVLILALIPVASQVFEELRDIESDVPVAQNFSTTAPGELPAFATVAELQGVEEAEKTPVERQPVKAVDPVPEKKITFTRAPLPVNVNPLPVPEPVKPLPNVQPPSTPPTPNQPFKKFNRLDPFQTAQAKPLDVKVPKNMKEPKPQLVDEGKVEFGRDTPGPKANVPPSLPNNPPTSDSPPPDVKPVPIQPKGMTGNPIKKSYQIRPHITKRIPTLEVAQADEYNLDKVDITPPMDNPGDKTNSEAIEGKVRVEKQDNAKGTLKPILPSTFKMVKNNSLPINKPGLQPVQGELNLKPVPSKPPTNPLPRQGPKKLPEVQVNLPEGDKTFLPAVPGKKGQKGPITQLVLNLKKEAISPVNSGQVDQKILKKLEQLQPSQFGKEKLKNLPFKDRPNLAVGQKLKKALPRKLPSGSKVALVQVELPSRTMFMLRTPDPETKRELAKLFGGTDQSEAAIERGLKWLAEIQEKDGHWRLDRYQGSGGTRTAATALGVLPFLGAGHTHKKGSYTKTVDKALKWLIAQQEYNEKILKKQKNNRTPKGNLLAKGDKAHHHMYSHGLASIALCEAYGLTQDPELREPAQKALKFIEWAQHNAGGWRYRPKEKGDTSVFGWQVMALKSGQMAGLDVSPETFKKAQKYLKNVEGRGSQIGQFGYENPGPRPTMTAQGLLCLQLMGYSQEDPRMQAGSNYLLEYLPQKNRETSYYYYHANQVMYFMQGKFQGPRAKRLNAQGLCALLGSGGGSPIGFSQMVVNLEVADAVAFDPWKLWNWRLREMNIQDQVLEGQYAGSWNPGNRDNWEDTGGRIYATSLRLLMLEVYYRHLPLYEQLEK